VPQHPHLYPFITEWRLIRGISLPPTWRLCWLSCRKPTCFCRMRSKLPFTRRSPVSGRDIGRGGQRLVEAPASVYGFSRCQSHRMARTSLTTSRDPESSSQRLRTPAELDVETHFQSLAHTPAEVLRHLGSPAGTRQGSRCSSVTCSGRIINLEAFRMVLSS
jgi:hypothetical protein